MDVKQGDDVAAFLAGPSGSSRMSPTIEIMLHTWNEAHMLPYSVRFYQTRFPTPGTLRITVHDQTSTDGTRELARRLGCQVHTTWSDHKLDVARGRSWRNNVWKASTADWVLIVDTDEWMDVWPDRLATYEVAGVTAVKARGAYLVWPSDTLDLSQEPRGVWKDNAIKSHGVSPVHMLSKPALFYRKAMNDTGISVGGHTARPTGRVKWLHETPIPLPMLFHAKYFDFSSLAARFANYRPRMTQENIQNGWGTQYLHTDNGTILAQFAHMRDISQHLPWRIF